MSSPSGGTIEVVGLSGSGKSTIGRVLAERLSLPFVDFAEALLSSAGLDISNHDLITQWTPAVVNHLVGEVQQQLAARSLSGELYVLETHICPNVPGGGYRPTPPARLSARHPRGIITVMTSYEDLLHLRSLRAHRRDGVVYSREEFELDNVATFSASLFLASLTNIPCFACRNSPGFLDKATESAVDFAADLMASTFA